MSTFAQPLPVALRERIAVHVDRALAQARTYPPEGLADERAFLVYATDALFAYYLGEDGAVYELDMDSSRGAMLETSAATIREVYEQAVTRHPELAGLREVAIVERVAPLDGLIQGFHAGVHTWDPKTETRTQAIERHARYFADRLEGDGPAYVVQRVPGDAYAELHLVGDELQLRVNGRSELVARGTRAELAATLRSANIADVILAVEQMLAAAR